MWYVLKYYLIPTLYDFPCILLLTTVIFDTLAWKFPYKWNPQKYIQCVAHVLFRWRYILPNQLAVSVNPIMGFP